jgi:hypothetical protein
LLFLKRSATSGLFLFHFFGQLSLDHPLPITESQSAFAERVGASSSWSVSEKKVKKAASFTCHNDHFSLHNLISRTEKTAPKTFTNTVKSVISGHPGDQN